MRDDWCMTKNELLRKAQELVLAKHYGAGLNRAEQAIVDEAFDVWGPEGVYMDGELFAEG